MASTLASPDMETQRQLLRDSLADVLEGPVSWNPWQAALARLLRRCSCQPWCEDWSSWAATMERRFGPAWRARVSATTVSDAYLQLATHAYARRQDALPPAPDLDAVLADALHHVLPWNNWQRLLSQLHRRTRSGNFNVRLDYDAYRGHMERRFDVTWQQEVPRRAGSRVLAAACAALRLPPPPRRQRRLRRAPRCRLLTTLQHLREHLERIRPHVQANADFVAAERLLARALRQVSRARPPAAVAEASLANLTPGRRERS